jgi:hypothetical protein
VLFGSEIGFELLGHDSHDSERTEHEFAYYEAFLPCLLLLKHLGLYFHTVKFIISMLCVN